MIEFGVGWLGEAYLWVKALHVAFVIFWMAGLFMVPRFLVYWHPVPPASPEAALWDERCQRLRRIILTPAMLVTWAAGLSLGFHLGWPLWLVAKLLFVLGLAGFHGWVVGMTRRFAAGERPVTERTLRMANEIPSLVTFAVVVLVIVKPF
ncbi:MAG: CopD family protein [Sphingomonadales bacterium]|jgi:putative membrane protein